MIFSAFQTFRLMDFLFVFTFGVYGAELIARSAHFPTIHLTFLDSKSFSATLLSRFFAIRKEAIWQLKMYGTLFEIFIFCPKIQL